MDAYLNEMDTMPPKKTIENEDFSVQKNLFKFDMFLGFAVANNFMNNCFL